MSTHGAGSLEREPSRSRLNCMKTRFQISSTCQGGGGRGEGHGRGELAGRQGGDWAQGMERRFSVLWDAAKPSVLILGRASVATVPHVVRGAPQPHSRTGRPARSSRRAQGRDTLLRDAVLWDAML